VDKPGSPEAINPLTPEEVVLYLRVSTPDQDLAGQARDLEEYATRRGWKIAARYQEKVSGTGTIERTEYARLLRDAAAADRAWKHVLVWSLDRWSRAERFTEALESMWELEHFGVAFHSLREPALDTPPDGKPELGRDVLRALLPLMASYESKRISERVLVAMREIRQGHRMTRSGRPVGRPVRLTPDKLREIARLRQEGTTWATVAVQVGLPKETCRRSYFDFRTGRVTVDNTPTGERVHRHPSKPSRGEGNP
jgi:DNA invertase Pin-like site-specific DNA recombinase